MGVMEKWVDSDLQGKMHFVHMKVKSETIAKGSNKGRNDYLTV